MLGIASRGYNTRIHALSKLFALLGNSSAHAGIKGSFFFLSHILI